MNELSDDFIDSLIKEDDRPRPPRQEGPVRYVDVEMRCGSRGCSSPTYIKVNGLARCNTHALKDCNSMLVEAGFKGV